MEFCFVYRGTDDPIAGLEPFTITLYDMDDSGSGYNEDIFVLTDSLMKYSFREPNNTQVGLEVIQDDCSICDIASTADGDYYHFFSTEQGTGKDNPSNTEDLDLPLSENENAEVQRQRTFSMTFKGEPCFNIEMSCLWPGYVNQVDFYTVPTFDTFTGERRRARRWPLR